MTDVSIPAHATCRAMGCYRKATEVIYDTKGRRQYCCDLHKGNNKKEKTSWTTGGK